MKISEIIVESHRLTESVGRDLQHVEDIIYIDGPQAALGVVNRLAQLGQDSTSMTIKWDGCIHPDHILQTDQGQLRIEEVIDKVNNGNKVSVLGFDFNKKINSMVEVSCASKKDGDKPWVEIELENGDVLKMTEDHEVFTTNRGWVEAKDLTDSDDIKGL